MIDLTNDSWIMVMVTLEGETGMSEKAESEIWMSANPREASVQGPAQRQDLGGAQVGQLLPFDIACAVGSWGGQRPGLAG